MLVFSTPLVNCCPSTFSLTFPTPPPSFLSKRTVGIYRQCGGGWGVLSCVVDHILFLNRFITYKIDTPPQTKTPVKTTFRDWCLYSSFFHGLGGSAALAGARHGEHDQGAGEARPEEPPPRPHRLRQRSHRDAARAGYRVRPRAGPGGTVLYSICQVRPGVKIIMK
jgi:hypothetical protein